jgi:hypothetical protein
MYTGPLFFLDPLISIHLTLLAVEEIWTSVPEVLTVVVPVSINIKFS